jgi:hypothetical protein
VRIGLGINGDCLVEEPGDAISVFLTEPGGQQATWSIDVWAIVGARGSAAGRGRGKSPRVFVGTINTVAANNSTQLTRVVGQAVCPGALAWVLSATGPATTFQPPGFAAPTDAMAELDAAVSPCCGQTMGIYYPNVPSRIIQTGGAPAASRTDFTSPILFDTIFGYGPVGEGAAEDVVFLFNSTSVPALGSLPFAGLSFAVPPGGSFNFSLAVPLLFSTGLTWAISSTQGTFTASADLFVITTRCQW